MNPDFEILAPAGSMEILRAVIDAGADAVYLGGTKFGARAYANNFSEEEMLAALDYAHLRGVKVYLTVNTLLKNRELDELYDYLKPYYEHGLDAVLVQDFGALCCIHSWFPMLPIHTSTQMTVTGVEGVRLLQQYGVTRVVMAREVSIPEMKRIHEETGIEIEAFVHGALCYSYSGQCLFSSLLGGRSGNRGRCAQPCRLPYTVRDEQHKTVKKESYILSLKDFCGIDHLGEFRDAGVYSLKIEGRMKQASYAASVVAMYRKYVDMLLDSTDCHVTKEDREKLASYGNRCGFTDAFFHRHNGEDMVTYQKPSFTSEAKEYIPNRRYVPIRGAAFLKVGEPSVLQVKHPDLEEWITVEGTAVESAKNQPMSREDISARLQKTKDTAFAFEDLSVETEGDIFIPNGALNQLRRSAIEEMERRILQRLYREAEPVSGSMEEVITEGFKEQGSDFGNMIIIEQREQLWAVLSCDFADTIAVSADAYRHDVFADSLEEDISRIKKTGKKAVLLMPSIFRQRTSEFYRGQVDFLKRLELDAIIVKNLEEIGFCRQFFLRVPLIGDHNLYTYNDVAQDTLEEWGVAWNTVPYELNRQEIQKRNNRKSFMCIYGYYPLMTTANCVHRNACGCDKDRTLHYLEDRYHKLFPVQNCCEECYNIIYNSLPTLLFQNLEELKRAGLNRYVFHFTVESKGQMKQICKLFSDLSKGNISCVPRDSSVEYTNGHYKRGVE